MDPLYRRRERCTRWLSCLECGGFGLGGRRCGRNLESRPLESSSWGARLRAAVQKVTHSSQPRSIFEQPSRIEPPGVVGKDAAFVATEPPACAYRSQDRLQWPS